MSAIIANDLWTVKRVDRDIFGGFIESGFGRQVNGLWSEMLFNRAFREIPKYKEPTWQWLGIDESMYNSNAPFWHSGYEECDWQPIGEPAFRRTLGTMTIKGLTTLLVNNPNAGSACGLEQREIYLEEGREYKLKLFAGRKGHIGEAGLNGFGDAQHSENTMPLSVQLGDFHAVVPLSTVCQNYEWTFNAKHTGRESLRLSFDWEGTVALVCASLMPTDNIDGWRADVVEKLRDVAHTVVRFPGGCFTSFYEWEKTIGDRDTREPSPSYYWGGMEDNDVGLDEFMRLSELADFKPQICFNMMSSTPFKARQLVEYLNSSADTGMGRLRALNGRETPYNVRLFEMDNEPARKWTAEQYSRMCVEFANEMRLADPDIELMFAAYAYSPEFLRDMLEIVGSHIQYVIYRNGEPEFVPAILAVIREYNLEHKTSIKLANTEWLPPCDSIEPFEDAEISQRFRWRGEMTYDYRKVFSIQQISWNYALNGARRLLDYIGYGGDFAIANFNNMCNTWGQNVIEAYKEGCELSNMGRVFSFFHRVFKPCFACGTQTDDERVFAMFVRDDSGEGLYVINHSSACINIDLPDGEWVCTDGLCASTRLSPRAAVRVTAKVNGCALELPPLSLLFLRKE